MIAALAKTAVEEIAWEGPPGISWSHLLATLEQQHGEQIDRAGRKALWRELCDKPEVFVRAGKGARAQKQVAEPPEDNGKILLDISDNVRSHFLMLDAHPDIVENELSRKALQFVAKSRAKGCTGASISTQLGVNCRDLFYVLEALRTAGLLVGVMPLLNNKEAKEAKEAREAGKETKETSDPISAGNLFIFVRFFDTESVENGQIQAFLQQSSSWLKNQILSALQLHESNVSFEQDLRNAIGQSLEESSSKGLPRRTVQKIFQRIRLDMVAAGDLECVRAWDHRSKYWRDALCIPGKHAGGPTPEPLLAITNSQVDDASTEQPDGSLAGHLPSSNVVPAMAKATLRVSERSHTQQAEDLVRCCSKFCNGVTGPEIADSLGIRRKHCERIQNDLVKRQRVTRVFESDGKTHLNRYFDANPKAAHGNKRPSSASPAQKPSKQAKEAGGKRVDATWVRRQQQVMILLQKRGLLTPLELLKIAAEDDALGKMDRKTANKLFHELADSNKNIGIAVSENSSDRADKVQYAFWKSLHSKESARNTFEEIVRAMEQTRLNKLRRTPAALTDIQEHQLQLHCLAQNTVKPRRSLPANVPAQNLRRLGGIEILTTPQAALDQKTLQHYGFITGIATRTQLLHEMLLRKGQCDFTFQWTPSKIVDEMDLQVFLQIIGCGTYQGALEELLLSGKPLLIKDVPDELRRVMLRHHSGAGLRAVQGVRKLMRHLTNLGLANSSEGDDPSIQIRYQLNQSVSVPIFRSDLDPVSDPAGTFDLAQPKAMDAYWTCLRNQVEAWRIVVGSKADDASSDDPQKAEKDDMDKSKERRSRRTVVLPVNHMMPEIFQSKNWMQPNWLTPHQRASLNNFFNDVHARAEASNPDDPEQELRTPQILTPKSAEVMALSRKITVPPDKIIKYCKHLAEVRPHPSGNHVEFSSLLAVRFHCHLCGHLCFQRTSITEHYAKVHGEKLPEDESKFSEADFYAQRLEQARPKRIGRRRVRKRNVPEDDATLSRWPQAEGDRSEEEEERWGAEPADDSSWLQLFAFAESMACLQQMSEGKTVPNRPVGCELRTDATTWPMLSRLTGRSAAYCRGRLSGLLSEDLRNRRSVAAIRSSERQAENKVIPLGMKGNIGRAVAKSLLLTCHEVPSYWWRAGFLNADIKAMVDCVIRQWQCDGLVSRYKEKGYNKLPPRARPLWILTWFTRNRMFGRGGDAPRWQDVLSLLLGSQNVKENMLPESSDGAQLFVVSGAVANDSASLCADWSDGDFYRRSLTCPPPWQANGQVHSDEEDEPEETQGTSSKSAYGGIQSHLQLTADEPTLKSILISLNRQRLKIASQFLMQLSVSQDVLAKIVGGASEPVNPQMQYCGHAGRAPEEEPEKEEEQEDNGEDVWEEEDEAPLEAEVHASNARMVPSQFGQSSDQAARRPAQVSTMRAAFAAYVEVSSGSEKVGTQVEDLLSAAAFLFKSIALSQGEKMGHDPTSSDGELLPGVAVGELRAIYAETCTACRVVSFHRAVRCLEDLRLLVPFPCGNDFCLVLARTAAPYCFSYPDEAEKKPSKDLLQLLQGFQQQSFGSHWLLPYVDFNLTQESLREAAGCVVFTALGSDSGMLERWLLPPGLVAPCAWVNAKGQINTLVLQLLLSRLLQLLLQKPFSSPSELLRQNLQLFSVGVR